LIKNTIEELVIELLKSQGFDYIYALEILRDSERFGGYDDSLWDIF
jgi:hypothetical protein